MERTLVFIKPDGVQRGLVGEIILRLEKRGLRIVALKMLRMSEQLAETHYAEHKGKDFFDPLVRHVTSGPVVAMVLEGERAIELVRRMIGNTNPAEAQPGTIRGDLALTTRLNLVHASDSPASAEVEINRFFSSEEIVSSPRDIDRWVFV
jgi:nucleoside-diphosphate kinase